MKPKFLILLLIGIVSVNSCKKENNTHPVSANTTVLKGANGSEIYSGHTDPTDATGAVGDFYINLTTDMFFGPKTPTGWGTSISLNAIGSIPGGGTMYSGSGAPSPTLGITGDFYLDTTAYMLYGPKTENTSDLTPGLVPGCCTLTGVPQPAT